jgi:hypothetical protein
MFLTMLNEAEKRAFAVLAQRLVAADEVLRSEELQALETLWAEMGIASPPADGRDESELAAAFETRRSRVVALLELLGLAYSDRDFCLDEESMITAVAHEMGLDAAELDRLDRWVADHLRRLDDAFALMAE